MALSFADELLGSPTLLEQYGRRVGADDDVTLVVYAPDYASGELEQELERALRDASVDTVDGPDILGLALPSDPALEEMLAAAADWLLTGSLPRAPFSGLPVAAPAEMAATAGRRAGWRSSTTLGGADPLMPERAFPGMPHAQTMREHALRYAFALEHVAGVHVLDLGCGTGYGSEMLTWTARRVSGFDLWQPAAHELPAWPGGAVLSFGHDLCADPLPRAEVAVAFEVIEHLGDAPAALRHAFAAVQRLVLSFPNPTYHGSHHNAYHVNDWSLQELEHELCDAALGSFAQLDLHHWHQGPDGLIHEGRRPDASYWLLVSEGRT